MPVLVRGLLFTVVVPGLGGVAVPFWILAEAGRAPVPSGWLGVIVIVVGAALYAACLRLFAVVGGGTPGPWDPPRHLVAVGPYRWVRNPIYIAALLVVVGEGWLYASPPVLVYAAVLAVAFHLFVVGYEEPTLGRAFGASYAEYRRRVPRWIPRPPRGV